MTRVLTTCSLRREGCDHVAPIVARVATDFAGTAALGAVTASGKVCASSRGVRDTFGSVVLCAEVVCQSHQSGQSVLAALGVLLVLVALLGGLSALNQPVDLVGVRVAPLAQPVLEPG